MNQDIQLLHQVWNSNRAAKDTHRKRLTFASLANSIISTGPFSFYVIDFFDMSLSQISPSLYEMHDFDPDTITFNDILGAIHPDDIDFVVKAEEFLTRFFSEEIGREKLLSYKISYCHRAKFKNGEYALVNHQAIMLTMDGNGYGKSLNIHTRIDHLSNHNTYKISLIGLNGESSYMNISLEDEGKDKVEFSKREIDIIKALADGKSNDVISRELFISPLTVKKHRSNIMEKSQCSNTAQLIKNCIQQGLL